MPNDILAIIVDVVGKALNVPVSTEVDETPTLPYIAIARYGGPPSRFEHYDRPVISARVYASSETAAYELAQRYNAAMCDLVYQPHVTSVQPNAFALLSNAKGMCIYQLTHAVVTN